MKCTNCGAVYELKHGGSGSTRRGNQRAVDTPSGAYSSGRDAGEWVRVSVVVGVLSMAEVATIIGNFEWPHVLWWLPHTALIATGLMVARVVRVMLREEKPEKVDENTEPQEKPMQRHRHEFQRRGGVDIIDEKWKDHDALCQFAAAVAFDKCNFSHKTRKDCGVDEGDYEKLKADFIRLEYFVRKSVGMRKTLQLRANGYSALEAMADTSPTP